MHSASKFYSLLFIFPTLVGCIGSELDIRHDKAIDTRGVPVLDVESPNDTFGSFPKFFWKQSGASSHRGVLSEPKSMREPDGFCERRSARARARRRMQLSHACPTALDSRPQFNSVLEKSFSKHVSLLRREPIEVNWWQCLHFILRYCVGSENLFGKLRCNFVLLFHAGPFVPRRAVHTG